MGELSKLLQVQMPGSCGLSCTPKVASSDEHNYPWFSLVVTLKAHPSRDRQGASNALFRFSPTDSVVAMVESYGGSNLRGKNFS